MDPVFKADLFRKENKFLPFVTPGIYLWKLQAVNCYNNRYSHISPNITKFNPYSGFKRQFGYFYQNYGTKKCDFQLN
jgi:hypothetical protein